MFFWQKLDQTAKTASGLLFLVGILAPVARILKWFGKKGNTKKKNHIPGQSRISCKILEGVGVVGCLMETKED